MQYAIVLGASMVVTILSLGFVAPESVCQEASCFAPLCFLQLGDPEHDGDQEPRFDRRQGGNRPMMRGPHDGRDNRGGRDDRGGRTIMDEMPQHKIERVMEIAREIDPELADRLGDMCQDDPEAFNRLIRRQGRRLGSLVELRESDPDLFEVKVNELKLDAEIFQVTKTIQELSIDAEVSEVQIVALRGLVRAKTALSIRKQTLYIDRLERHLQGLRDRLATTSARFDEVVEERIEQLLGKSSSPPTD